MGLDLKNTVYSFDANTIDMYKSLCWFGWSTFRKTNEPSKKTVAEHIALHVVIDLLELYIRKTDFSSAFSATEIKITTLTRVIS